MANYTDEELNNVGRVELRRRAVALGMNNKDCTNSTSEQLKQFILEAQEGAGEEGEEPKKSRARTKAEGEAKTPKGNGKPRTTRAAKAKERVEDDEVPKDSRSDESAKIDHLGAALDESTEKLAEKLDSVLENQDIAGRQRYIMMGLLSDVYKMLGEPDELNERIKELEEEWDGQGN